MCYLLCCKNSPTPDIDTDEVRKVPNGPGNLLIFVNPHSGTGHGVKIFRDKIKPKLIHNNLSYELVITQYGGHADTIIREHPDLNQFDGIVIVSGDGLVFEVVNSLLKKQPDGYKLLQALAFFIVPTGSGNGLLSSVFYDRGISLKQPAFATTAIDLVSDLQAKAFAVNLTRVQTDDFIYGSFISIGWGLLADIDIESEKYRKSFGSARFFIEAVRRGLGKPRSYRGRLSFFVSGQEEQNTSPDSNNQEAFSVYEPRALNHDELFDQRQSDNPDAWIGRYMQCEASEADLKKPIPLNDDKWTIVEDDFVFVYVTTTSHISTTSIYSPSAKLVDNKLYLTYMLAKDVKNRIALLRFLDSIESGKHLQIPFLKSTTVSSFRLEPIDDGSYLVVDGEVIHATRLQGTVTDFKMHVAAK